MNDSANGAGAVPSAASHREVLTDGPGAKSASVAEKSSHRLTRSEKRRRRLRNRYNREYMRRWRATPHKKPRKKRCLRGRNPRSTQGRFRAKSQIRAKNDGAPICGICRRQRAISVVTRFQLTQETESGFRAVRVPYCGLC
jgi:hypothetical protein